MTALPKHAAFENACLLSPSLPVRTAAPPPGDSVRPLCSSLSTFQAARHFSTSQYTTTPTALLAMHRGFMPLPCASSSHAPRPQSRCTTDWPPDQPGWHGGTLAETRVARHRLVHGGARRRARWVCKPPGSQDSAHASPLHQLPWRGLCARQWGVTTIRPDFPMIVVAVQANHRPPTRIPGRQPPGRRRDNRQGLRRVRMN